MSVTDKFKVVAVSENTNSFGLKQCVMMAKSGVVYKCCANNINMPNKGDVLDIRAIFNAEGNVVGYDFTSKGFEIPERIDSAPQGIIDEVWN